MSPPPVATEPVFDGVIARGENATSAAAVARRPSFVMVNTPFVVNRHLNVRSFGSTATRGTNQWHADSRRRSLFGRTFATDDTNDTDARAELAFGLHGPVGASRASCRERRRD